MVKLLRPIAWILVAITLVWAGGQLREATGIELSPQSLRARVAELGTYGPLIFLALMAFRPFLMLPSSILLSGGGLLFGVVGGTLLGWLGCVLSAAVLFGITRGARVSIPGLDRRSEKFGRVSRQINQSGPLIIALVTAHPFAPMSIFHAVGGATRMPWRNFFVAVVVAAPLRAFGYSFFGMTLADIGSFEFYAATFVLLALVVVPLIHKPTRERLIGSDLETSGE